MSYGCHPPTDLEAERAVLPNDIPHALVLNYVYDLPFGEGRRWLNRPGVLNVILGGWTIAGIHRYQSGYPLPVLMNNTLPIFNDTLCPDLIPGQSPSSGVGSRRFPTRRCSRASRELLFSDCRQ